MSTLRTGITLSFIFSSHSLSFSCTTHFLSLSLSHPLLSPSLPPSKTAGHALWSGVMAVYIVSAVTVYEEPALIEEFGDEYKQYMKEVPGFIPDLKKLFMAY